MILERLVDSIAHSLRDKKRESYYLSAKSSGVRTEVLRRLEDSCDGVLVGNASSLSSYVDDFCRRFPGEASMLFYNLSLVVMQNVPKDK